MPYVDAVVAVTVVCVVCVYHEGVGGCDDYGNVGVGVGEVSVMA